MRKCLIILFTLIFVSCGLDKSEKGCYNEPMTNIMNWKQELENQIELLGHRNWIVVTDMAYPLQSKPGIQTINTGENYHDVLSFVDSLIKAQSHVKANVYQDKELKYLTEGDVAGITDLRDRSAKLFDGKISYVVHEELIARLDEVSQVFNVVILKSTLTMPYTSTFFELDCKYWEGKEIKMD